MDEIMLDGLEFIGLTEKFRDIHEGEFHNGKGAVVRLIAKNNNRGENK